MNELEQQLHKDAAEGRLGPQNKPSTSGSEQVGTKTTSTSNHCASDYEESDDEIHTLCDSEEEDITERRRRSRGLVVHENTTFSTFKWKV